MEDGRELGSRALDATNDPRGSCNGPADSNRAIGMQRAGRSPDHRTSRTKFRRWRDEGFSTRCLDAHCAVAQLK